MTALDDLQSWVKQQRPNIVSDLVGLASLETPSNDLALLGHGLRWIEEWLGSRVGAPAARRHIAGGAHGDIVTFDYPPVGPSTAWVSVLCHFDTVWDAGTLRTWPVQVDGDTVTGPGVFDMKAGIVQLVWGLVASTEHGLSRPGIRLILTSDEEIGSISSRPVIEAEVRSTTAVLVFEASKDGAVKTARKGGGIFEIDVTGRESHAGLDPESGISAVDEIARLTLALHAAADSRKGTTVNVGVIGGGTRYNVTAGKASASVDIRISTLDEAERIESFLQTLAPHNPGAEIVVRGDWNRPVMLRTPGTADLFDLAAATAKALGFTLREAAVGGYSDGNIAAALGIPVLDGLGAVGGGAHSRDEWVSIDGMLQRAALTAGLLERLAHHGPESTESPANHWR